MNDAEKFEMEMLGKFYGIEPTGFDYQVTRPEWLMERMIPAKSIGVCYGPSNGGKTHFVLDLVMAMLAGRNEWCGTPIKPGPVVMFSESMGNTKARLVAYRDKYGATKYPLYLFPPMQLNHLDIESLAYWFKKMGDQRPSMVVFDTFSTSFGWLNGKSENDNSAVAELYTSLETMLMPDMADISTILLVHHTPKADSTQTRGAGAITANLDYSINVEWDADLQVSTAKWIKDKWRLVSEDPEWHGKPGKAEVNFTDGVETINVSTWMLMDRKAVEAQKEFAMDIAFGEAQKSVISAVNKMIDTQGRAYVQIRKSDHPGAADESVNVKLMPIVGTQEMATKIKNWFVAGKHPFKATEIETKSGELKGLSLT